MFSKPNKSQAPAKGSAPSILSKDARMTGDLVSQGELHVDGQIQGDVRCHTLVIGETGSVVGEILAELVHVHGEVSGQIRARKVTLAHTAHVTGDVTHESLAIEAGAHIAGRCIRADFPKEGAATVETITEVAVAGQLPAPAE